MIEILDYGMGNLRSVQQGFKRAGAQTRIIQTAQQVSQSSKLVIPGVGAFADAANTLRQGDLVPAILDFIAAGKPLLGICLGLQVLFDVSYEHGEHKGLGVFGGKVVHFEFDSQAGEKRLKVPHMGWNQINWDRAVPIYAGLENGCFVYFVHSYHVVPLDSSVVATQTEYGYKFVSSIWRDNVFATQFHPEKSQQVGLTILKNFAKL